MKISKKSFIFIMTTATMLFEVSGALFGMEENNNNEQLTKQSPTKKKKKKKKQTLNLDKEFGVEDNREKLENLNLFANSLLFQHKFIQDLGNEAINMLKSQDFQQQLRNNPVFNVSKELSSGSIEYEYRFNLNYDNPNLINIFLKYPDIFSSIDQPKVSSSSKNRLELSEQLIKNSDKDIQKLGNALQLISNAEIAKTIYDKGHFKLEKTIREYYAKYSYLEDFYMSNQRIQKFLPYFILLENGNLFSDLIKQKKSLLNNKQFGYSDISQEMLDCMKKNKILANEYAQRKKNINKEYVATIKKIRDVIDKKINNKREWFDYLKVCRSANDGCKYFESLPETILFEEVAQQELEFEEEKNVVSNKNTPKKSPKNKAKKNTGKKKSFISSNNNNSTKQEKREIEEDIEKIALGQSEPKENTLKIESDMQSDDDSYIKEETEDYIKIVDPKNNITIKLFKTSESNQAKNIPAINYTEWVDAWFKNPQEALKNQGYADLESKKLTDPAEYHKPIIIHSFAKAVDLFIEQWGKQATTKSRCQQGKNDILITLPGAIYYDVDNNNEPPFEMGLFVYIIDSENHQWYHRNFTSRSGKELLEEYMEKGFYEVEFPPLG